MTNIIRKLPTKQLIGLAFSGGLDTSAAIVWVSNKGGIVYTYTANLGQYDEKHMYIAIGKAISYGAKKAYIIDCRKGLIKEGLIALQCKAFHIETANLIYFNTTPLSRIVTSISIVLYMNRYNICIWSDGSTYKGNDIERFYRYGLLINNKLTIYKPWLDNSFVNELGGRKEMYQLMIKNGFYYKKQKKRYYSTDCNILGNTYEAKELEYLDFNIKKIELIMCLAFWKKKAHIPIELLKLRYKHGLPTAINNIKLNIQLALLEEANSIGSRHGIGVSDQLESRIIETKSRGVYESPGVMLLYIVYERLTTGIHDVYTIEQLSSYGRTLGKLLYLGRWFDSQSLSIKEAVSKWITAIINGELILELRKGNDYSIICTCSDNLIYNLKAITMEKANSKYTSRDRIGQLNIANFSIENTRAVLLGYSKLKKVLW
ncbi:argininosuccinate synthase [Candidatus Tremblaya phenacola]|uniref:Argininosuccinate synthase n=1 Tax=Candidatus Tremblayella phenacoccinincola TaxID=1010676 RepID=A0A2G0V797_9PROT|nr:argininosuccinate synthase [Candidatus Tremblaya phenacola]PHN16337.1 Argininosuccinate synthase [Candidatus Tremblaya phenacola]